jgi:predicted CXXCH cytochrome family protein
MARPKKEWRLWYSRADWLRRRDHQLKLKPLCEDCEAQGRITPATIAHHIEPHGGDINKFLRGALKSLCVKCHNKLWAVDKRGYSAAVDVSGKPIDERHPALQQRAPFKEWPADTPGSPYSEPEGEPAAPEPAGSLPRHIAALLARGRKRSAAK